MVMHNLQEIMFAILKHHEDAPVLQDGLHMPDDIHMAEFRAQPHLPDGGLRDASVDGVAFAVGLELFDGEERVGGWVVGGKAFGFVDATVGAAADEADDLVAVLEAEGGLVSPHIFWKFSILRGQMWILVFSLFRKDTLLTDMEA